jgi:hypothetical protein
MIEAYVSPDVFRRGVNVYLRRFLYAMPRRKISGAR